MKLYHYSAQKHAVLKTKRITQPHTPESLKVLERQAHDMYSIGTYIDHISFFFDPIPSMLVSKLFGMKHRAWFKGNVLYEHVVEVDSLRRPFNYDVVETPTELTILDETVWAHDNIDFFRQYMRCSARRKLTSGEQGNDYTAFAAQVEKYQGTTEHYFRAAAKRHDWDENRIKYAASVPHAMIYPIAGKIHHQSVNRITVGSDKRTPV